MNDKTKGRIIKLGREIFELEREVQRNDEILKRRRMELLNNIGNEDKALVKIDGVHYFFTRDLSDGTAYGKLAYEIIECE